MSVAIPRITVYVLIHLFEGVVNDVWVFANRTACDEKFDAILKERGFKSLQELRDRTEDEDFVSVERELVVERSGTDGAAPATHLFSKGGLAEAILLDLYATQRRQHPTQIAFRLRGISRRGVTPAMVRARLSELRRKDLVFNDQGQYRLAPKGEELIETKIAPKLTDDELNLFG